MNRPRRPVLARVAAAAACALLALMALAGQMVGASVSFGTPTSTSTFGTGIVFVQPISGSGFTQADIVLSLPGDVGPSVVSLTSAAVSSTSLTFTFDTSNGQIQPNTQVTAYFQVVFSDGSTQTGPVIHATYQDDRFHWQTLSGKLVTLHWYSGSTSFAQQALTMGENGIAKSAQFMGVTETQPVDFFVYADQQSFYDALGPGTRDNVGGEANTTTRTLFALIPPDQLSYASTVVPHELTHVVFADGTSNPYHSPPRWLNEGLAVYLSQGYDSSDKGLVSSAAASKTLMPLSALTGEFPTDTDRFYLAYAESVSSVDYMIRTYGQPAIAKMVKAYGTGASDDEAFTAAFGVTAEAVDKAWLAQNGITSSPTFGPETAPAGPVPPGWTNAGGVTVTAPPAAAGTAAPTETTARTAGSTASSGSSVELLLAGVIAAAGVVLIGVAIVLYRRPDRSPPPF
ncbi:MAG: peptidase MA family metallohydrolase [Candidatus Limnocylindrales bacterium]